MGFKRRWVYHLITVFFQSVLLLGVAYMTFYFKISNFQDRIMIAITTMMVVATIQSSINKMVPKTAYDKIGLFGGNPDWEPGWVKAYKINAAGQIGNLVVFLLFNIVFWSIALSHFYRELDLMEETARK